MAANTLATSNLVAKESLAVLKNMLVFSKGANRNWEDEFKSNMSRGYASGATINIKRPPRYTYRAGRVAVPQSTVQTTVPLTLQQGGCDLNFTLFERTVSMTDPDLQNAIMAAAATVANEIDRQGLDLVRRTAPNLVSVNKTTFVQPATQAEALALYVQAGRVLDDAAAPRDNRRNAVLSTGLNAASIQGLAGLFNNAATIGKQYGTGLVVDSLGLNIGMSQNTARHTNGAATATNVNGANQTGTAITVVAVAGGTLTAGTIITLPGVFDVNPQTRTSTGILKEFIVTADALAGATTINISPAVTPSGAFQNCTASPTTATPYVILGNVNVSADVSVAFHEDAYTLAMVPMFAPQSQNAKVTQVSDEGFTLKLTEYYDPVNDISNMRMDVLFGWAATYPELAVRIATTG
jgi:hypothetical protein